MKKEAIIPEGQQVVYDHYHFAPAIKVGQTVYVSGQGGGRADGTMPESLEEQLDNAFAKVKQVLEAAGATMADIVELLSYHVDIQKDAHLVFAVKDRHIPSDFPAWTAVGVAGLAGAGMLVEIKAVAVFGSAG